jgi:hypothetical protein
MAFFYGDGEKTWQTSENRARILFACCWQGYSIKDHVISCHQLRGRYYGMVASDEFEETELDTIWTRFS